MARSYNLIRVNVDVETAFDFVSDFTNAAAWDPQAASVTKATEGPIGVGTRFDLVTATVPMQMTYEIVEMDRPRRLVLEGRTWYLSFRDEVTFEATESGVDVHWRAAGSLRSILWIMNPVFSLIFQKIADKAVSGMVPAIEGRAAPQPTRSRGTLRRLALTLGVLVLVAAAAIWATYPGIGRLTYDVTMGAETRLAGLHTEYVEVNGLRMAYYEGGPTDAPTVVMIHGYSANRDAWVRFAAELDGYHVILLDLAGHGETPFVSGAGFSAPAQADRVAGLLDALEIDQVHIIGNSMGGFVSATFAHAYPERTLSLGLCDAAGVTSPQKSELRSMIEGGDHPFLFTDPAEYDSFYAMTMAQPPFLPGFVRDALARDQAQRRDQLAEIFVDFAGKDLLDDHLAEIEAPTLVIWGEEDRLVHLTASSVWMAGLPHAELVTYPGVGHMPMVEIPAQSAKDYQAFLEGL